jgi:hypothetical protein
MPGSRNNVQQLYEGGKADPDGPIVHKQLSEEKDFELPAASVRPARQTVKRKPTLEHLRFRMHGNQTRRGFPLRKAELRALPVLSRSEVLYSSAASQQRLPSLQTDAWT